MDLEEKHVYVIRNIFLTTLSLFHILYNLLNTYSMNKNTENIFNLQ